MWTRNRHIPETLPFFLNINDLPPSLVSFYGFAESLPERQQREPRHLKVLAAEWDSHNGYAAQNAEEQMNGGDIPPPQQNPKHIHKCGDAASDLLSVHDLGSERPKREHCEFPQLVAERNPDDRHYEQKSHAEIHHEDQ